MPDIFVYLLVLVLCCAMIAVVAVVACATACFLQWLADKVMERRLKG